MKKLIEIGFDNQDVTEFAYSTKLNAKVSKKCCMNFLVVSRPWSYKIGLPFIKNTKFEAFT